MLTYILPPFISYSTLAATLLNCLYLYLSFFLLFFSLDSHCLEEGAKKLNLVKSYKQAVIDDWRLFEYIKREWQFPFACIARQKLKNLSTPSSKQQYKRFFLYQICKAAICLSLFVICVGGCVLLSSVEIWQDPSVFPVSFFTIFLPCCSNPLSSYYKKRKTEKGFVGFLES